MGRDQSSKSNGKKRQSSPSDEDIKEWIASQNAESVFPVKAQQVMKMAKNGLLTAKEISLFRVQETPSSRNQRVVALEIAESDVQDEMEWIDENENAHMRLLDNFLIVNGNGEAVSLTKLDEQNLDDGSFLMFGSVVEPVALKEGEQLRLWARHELENLKRTERIASIVCKEWCIDLSFGDESIWVISDKGIWYKLRGEHGPGSALAPSPLYEKAFEEPRKRYEACLHIARLLQAPDLVKKPPLEDVIERAASLSSSGEWPFTTDFVLSRADFIAEQVESIQNFASTAKVAATVGSSFSKDLQKRRNQLISSLLAISKNAPSSSSAKKQRTENAKGKAALGKESEDERMNNDDEDDIDGLLDEDFHARRQSKSSTPRSSQSSTAWLFPLDDLVLLRRLEQIDREGKIPAPLRKIQGSAGKFNPVSVMPLPPVPTSLRHDMIREGLENDFLGSIFASFEAIQLLSDYLRLTPFGLEPFISALTFRPPYDVFKEKSTEKRFQQVPSFSSPLLLEVLLRLVEFILDQPEHKAIAERIINHEELALGAAQGKGTGALPFLNKLTLPHIILNLIVELERVALPRETSTVTRLEQVNFTPEGNDEALQLLSEESNLKLSPRTAKKLQEELEKMESAYPLTTEGYALVECRNILRQILEDPRSGPFSSKVDPQALGIPDYFEVIDKPMDLGTIYDRLYTGFYCPEKLALVTRKLSIQSENLIAWIAALCHSEWKQGWVFESTILLKMARNDLVCFKPQLKQINRGLLKKCRESCDTLAWVLQERKKELVSFDKWRREVLEKSSNILGQLNQRLSSVGASAVSDEDYSELRSLLKSQGLKMLEPLMIEFPPLGLNIGDSKSHSMYIKFIESMEVQRIPDLFQVSVAKLFSDQARRHPQLWNSVVPGDRLIFVNHIPATNMDSHQVAEIFKSMTFPVQLILARPDPAVLTPPKISLKPSWRSSNGEEKDKEALLSPILPRSDLQEHLSKDEEKVRESDSSGNDDPLRSAHRKNSHSEDCGVSAESSSNELKEPTKGVKEEHSQEADTHTQSQNDFSFNQPAEESKPVHGNDSVDFDTTIHISLDKLDDVLGGSLTNGEYGDDLDDIIDDEEEEGRGGGLDALFGDVQLVFNNCFKYNSKRAEISNWAQALKEKFEDLYQSSVVNLLERIDSTRHRIKFDNAHRRTKEETTVNDAVEWLSNHDLADIPPRVRCWILEWLLENVLQTEDVRNLLEEGTPSQRLAARIYRPRGPRSSLAPTGSDGLGSSTTPESKFLGVQKSPLLRLQPIGEDRLLNRYWWFDGDPLGRIFVEQVPTKRDCTSDVAAMGNSITAQITEVEEREKCLAEIYENQNGLVWGVLSTKRELDSLVESLNPLGKTEMNLLQNLLLRYRRIVSRMMLVERGILQRQELKITMIQDVFDEEFRSQELEDKVAFALQAATNCRPKKNQKAIQGLGPEIPVPSSVAILPLRASHLSYENKIGGSWTRRTRTELNQIVVPYARLQFSDRMNVWGHDVLSTSENASSRDLLIHFLLNIESVVWTSRTPTAMGLQWGWPRNRKVWVLSLEELKSFHPNIKEKWMSTKGSWVPPEPELGVVDPTFEVRFLSDRVLQFEAECVSHWCSAGSTSPIGSCVNLQWRSDRASWRAQVRNAKTVAELAVLTYTLATEAIRWEDIDQSFSALFRQHFVKHVHHSDLQQSGPFWSRLQSSPRFSLQDVTFGQVLSAPGCAETFGFVSFGAFLGSYLYAAYFDKVGDLSETLPSSFQKALLSCATAALNTAVNGAQSGGQGLQGSSRSASSHVPGNIGRMSGTNTAAIESMGTVKKAVLQVMGTLSMRQRDVADQLGCSQSHLSLWLNAKDETTKKKFEHRVINWVRLKNLVHGWVQPADVCNGLGEQIDIHRGIAPIPAIPDGIGPGETANPDLWQKTHDALMPLIRGICDSSDSFSDAQAEPLLSPVSATQNSSHFQQVNSDSSPLVDFASRMGSGARHPYLSLFRSASNISWADVIPFYFSPSTARAQLAECPVEMWKRRFSPQVQERLESSGLTCLYVGAKVVYFPEGHAFANAQSELRMAIEATRGGRSAVFGPTYPVAKCRDPVIAYVEGISYHDGGGSITGGLAPSPYCVVTLSPVSKGGEDYERIQMLSLDLGAKTVLHRPKTIPHSSLQLQDLIFQVVMHLNRMDEASFCLHHISPVVYTDLRDVVGATHSQLMDLATINQKVVDGSYESVEALLEDLEMMVTYMRQFLAESHKYSVRGAQAATALLLHAKLLLRHPETLCTLNDLEKQQQSVGQYPRDIFSVVIRPQFESEIPSYLALCETVQRSLRLEKGISKVVPWALGTRVTRRVSDPQAFGDVVLSGRIAGFRLPLTDMQLPWGSVVVRWDVEQEEGEVDTTLDMPMNAHQHMNPWELTAL